MSNVEEKRISCPNCDEPMEPGDTCLNPGCEYEDPAEGNNSEDKK